MAVLVAVRLNAPVVLGTAEGKLLAFLTAAIGDDQLKVLSWGLRAAALLILHQLLAGAAPDAKLTSALARSLNHAQNDIKVHLISGAFAVTHSLVR